MCYEIGQLRVLLTGQVVSQLENFLAEFQSETLARLCLRPTRHVDNSGSGRRLIDELW